MSRAKMLLAVILSIGVVVQSISAKRPVEATITDDEFDDHLPMTFNVGNHDLSFDLERNHMIDSRVPLYVGENGHIKRWQPVNEERYAAYRDSKNRASFVIKKNDLHPDGRSGNSYLGSFLVAGDHYTMEPAHKVSSKKRSLALAVDLRHLTELDHVVYKEKQEIGGHLGDYRDMLEAREVNIPDMHDTLRGDDDYEIDEDSTRQPRPWRYNRKHSRDDGGSDTDYDIDEESTRQPRLGGQDGTFIDRGLSQGSTNKHSKRYSEYYTLQMLLVLDHALYRRYQDLGSSNPESDIKFYFTHIVNGIDTRYSTIRDFTLKVRMVAMYLCKSSSDSPWTANHVTYEGSSTFTSAYDALDDFEAWIKTEEPKKQFGTFDQVTLYTGNYLYGSKNDDGSLRRIGGLADIGAICTWKGASINHASGVFPSIGTGAHEMGHNLGSQHDSNLTPGCPSGDQYIMAVAPGSLNENNFYHPYEFSSCSKKYMRDHLLKLQDNSENCLLDASGTSHVDDSNFQYNLLTKPGQRVDVDTQCKQYLGRDSYYCAGQTMDDQICSDMSCYNPETRTCQILAEQRADEGTTCGDRKWCIKGKCVYSGDAPSAKDKCIYGDFKGTFNVVEGAKTCRDVADRYKSECYEQHKGDCCETCERIKDTSRPDCEYGDRMPDYCRDIKKKDCYEASALNTCCETCSRYYTGNVGCEYGDKVSWCATMKSSGCYQSEDMCCEACKRHDTGDPNCRYGDQASWCSTLPSSSCKDNKVKCCQSCKYA